jgi:hypothetical protein
MWHHTLFSALLCLAMIGLYLARRDTSSLIVIGAVTVYVAGNTYLHIRHKDFRRETLYEYLLVSAAVLIVLLGALRH